MQQCDDYNSSANEVLGVNYAMWREWKGGACSKRNFYWWTVDRTIDTGGAPVMVIMIWIRSRIDGIEWVVDWEDAVRYRSRPSCWNWIFVATHTFRAHSITSTWFDRLERNHAQLSYTASSQSNVGACDLIWYVLLSMQVKRIKCSFFGNLTLLQDSSDKDVNFKSF